MREEDRQERIKEMLNSEPGMSGGQIFGRFVDRSRAAKWFGRNSILAEIFGASVANIYVSLARMEKAGTLRSQWEARSEPGKPRRRQYFVAAPPSARR